MGSNPSDLIKFEKQTTGENDGTWGTKTNTAMSRIEEAIAGFTNISVTGANYTLDDTQYTEHNDGTNTSESHVAMIKATGTLTGNRQIIVPLRTKHYMIWNGTGGAYSLTVGGSSGGTITLPQGFIQHVFCDGTNVEAASAPFDVNGNRHYVKGGDIASASPLVIDTDGEMFDVTGTTGFSAMTVTIGRLFVLQFDGILTMTHGAGTLDLIGAENITTAAGDVGIFYSTAANVVRMISWSPAQEYHSKKTRTINAQTGTTYTLVIGDAGDLVTMDNSSANTLTIPPNSSVAFATGTQIDIINKGAGVTSVTGGSGVTLNGVSTGTGALNAQYAAVSIVKIATDTWLMLGAHATVA